jgi:hypothetical protein
MAFDALFSVEIDPRLNLEVLEGDWTQQQNEVGHFGHHVQLYRKLRIASGRKAEYLWRSVLTACSGRSLLQN